MSTKGFNTFHRKIARFTFVMGPDDRAPWRVCQMIGVQGKSAVFSNNFAMKLLSRMPAIGQENATGDPGLLALAIQAN